MKDAGNAHRAAVREQRHLLLDGDRPTFYTSALGASHECDVGIPTPPSTLTATPAPPSLIVARLPVSDCVVALSMPSYRRYSVSYYRRPPSLPTALRGPVNT